MLKLNWQILWQCIRSRQCNVKKGFVIVFIWVRFRLSKQTLWLRGPGAALAVGYQTRFRWSLKMWTTSIICLHIFSNFSCMFLNLNNLLLLNYNCSVWINCSSDLKEFANFWPSALNFQSFSQSLEQFFLTVDQNNFGNKIPFLTRSWRFLMFHKL